MSELTVFTAKTPWPALLLVWCTGCGQRPTDAECTRLLDHYTEALVREENPEATPELVAGKQEQARAVAARDPRFDFSSCTRRVTRREYDCAMQAPSVDEIERCLVF